jgi:hypothetical protein
MNSGAEPMKVLVLSGPGFADQGDVLQQLQLNQNVRLSVFNVGAGVRPLIIEEFKTADLILMRGPWSATPEEMLYAGLLAKRLEPSFEILRQRILNNNSAKIIGIGRGGLIILRSILEGAKELAQIEWGTDLKELGPWASVRVGISKSEIFALLQGRALPKISAKDEEKFKPWITMISGQVAGWRISEGVYVSFVDFIALGDRSQLADFGYLDLINVATQPDILDMIVTGQAFRD